jgi:hypothetical protein
VGDDPAFQRPPVELVDRDAVRLDAPRDAEHRSRRKPHALGPVRPADPVHLLHARVGLDEQVALVAARRVWVGALGDVELAGDVLRQGQGTVLFLLLVRVGLLLLLGRRRAP